MKACTLAVVAVLVVPTSARAADTNACIDAHEQAQLLRRDGRLTMARKKLVTCAAAGCPQLVQSACASMVVDVDREQPSVIFAAKDARGADVSQATVTVDGAVATSRLDGKPYALDVGEHTLRFEAPAGRAEETVVVKLGEKNRVVTVTLGSPVAHPPREAAESASRPVPAVAIAFAAVAVVGLGSFTVFGLSGKSKEHSFDGCKPDCNPGDVHDMRTLYAVADVSLAVGIVAAGVATWLFVTRPEAPARVGYVVPTLSPHGAGLAGALRF